VRAAIDDYLRCSGVEITPDHEATSTYMAISLVVSTRGIALLENKSPLLKLFLSRVDDLIARVSKRSH